VTEVVSVARDGSAAARAGLERVVRAGGVVVFPADGVYGLACDPGRAEAIERIHALKGRETGKPSAVMFFAPLAMRELISTLGPRTRNALAALLPGPVTLVVDNPERLYPLACGEDPGRLGLRLIEGPLAGAGIAVFQTSANPAGEPPANRLDAVASAILTGADLAIDGGELAGSPSMVIDLTEIEAGGGWAILRPGALSSSELARRLAPGRGW
jgi:L-threonylcarbamoyladenylate synthase